MALQAAARRRDISLTLAMESQVTALSIVASTSFAKRRLRFSQAKMRSTSQRRGNRTKPRAAPAWFDPPLTARSTKFYFSRATKSISAVARIFDVHPATICRVIEP
jgi:hypothetical protein